MNPESTELVFEPQPTKTIRFPPIAYNSAEYSSLTLRELTIGEIQEAETKGAPLKQMFHLIQVVTDLPMQVVLKLSPRVIEACGDYFSPPSAPSQDTTGKT